MRVITTSGTREIKVALRTAPTMTTSYKAVVRNDNTRVESEIDVLNYTVSNYNDNNGQLAFNITDTYLEGDELTLKVTSTDGNTIYHRNKIFVTDQTPQDYNING